MQIEDLYKIIIQFQQEFYSFRSEMIDFRKETKTKLNKLSKAFVNIEVTLSYYADMYKLNKDKIDALGNRVTVLERKI